MLGFGEETGFARPSQSNRAQSIGPGYADEPKMAVGQALAPIDRTVEGLSRLMNACHDEMSMLSSQLAQVTQEVPCKNEVEPVPPASCRLDAKLIEIAAGLHALQNRLRTQRETLCL